MPHKATLRSGYAAVRKTDCFADRFNVHSEIAAESTTFPIKHFSSRFRTSVAGAVAPCPHSLLRPTGCEMEMADADVASARISAIEARITSEACLREFPFCEY